MNEKILPTVLMVIMVASAIAYATKGDARRTVYWLAAAVLTFVVTY